MLTKTGINNINYRNNKIIDYAYAGLVIITAVVITMVSGWEATGETWGYWYFSRIFSETYKFIILDRSPLYVIYLSLFTWISFPGSIIFEYLFTTCITVFILFIFFRSYFGLNLSLVASCIWLPFIQISEPPVQKLALVCSILAIMIRSDSTARFKINISYSLLVAAYLFRQTYMLLLFCFLFYDLYRVINFNGIKYLFSFRIKILTDWPILFVTLIYILFIVFQSPSPWNNVWFSDSQWFPGGGKSISGGGIQSLNWIYTWIKYGTFVGHDFYFTNQEAFGGATSLLSAAIFNPMLFLDICIYNFKNLVPTIMSQIWLPRLQIYIVDYIISCIVCLGIIYGAFKGASTNVLKVFVVGSLALVAVTVISIPKPRYMMPMIPLFVFAASWYGMKVANYMKCRWKDSKVMIQRIALIFLILGMVDLILYLLTKDTSKPERTTVLFIGIVLFFSCASILITTAKFASEKLRINIRYYLLGFPALLFVVVFSSGLLLGWAKIFNNAVSYVNDGQVRILEGKDFSMKKTYRELMNITSSCRGIMVLESSFIGAFINFPLDRIYSPWEIPPFGTLYDSLYKGLIPERVDCVLVSEGLATGVGFGTNIQLRYQNYLEPYIVQLKSKGAVTYNIPKFGQAFVLPR